MSREWNIGTLTAVARWLGTRPYRKLLHRHDGTFVAADESENLFVHVDTLPDLADALRRWPEGAEPIPSQKWIKVRA